MKDKIKVLVLADHPFSPSGVGTQTRYMVEGLLASGQFSFICFGGAVKHEDYSPQKFEKYGDDLDVYKFWWNPNDANMQELNVLLVNQQT